MQYKGHIFDKVTGEKILIWMNFTEWKRRKSGKDECHCPTIEEFLNDPNHKDLFDKFKNGKTVSYLDYFKTKD